MIKIPPVKKRDDETPSPPPPRDSLNNNNISPVKKRDDDNFEEEDEELKIIDEKKNNEDLILDHIFHGIIEESYHIYNYLLLYPHNASIVCIGSSPSYFALAMINLSIYAPRKLNVLIIPFSGGSGGVNASSIYGIDDGKISLYLDELRKSNFFEDLNNTVFLLDRTVSAMSIFFIEKVLKAYDELIKIFPIHLITLLDVDLKSGANLYTGRDSKVMIDMNQHRFIPLSANRRYHVLFYNTVWVCNQFQEMLPRIVDKYNVSEKGHTFDRRFSFYQKNTHYKYKRKELRQIDRFRIMAQHYDPVQSETYVPLHIDDEKDIWWIKRIFGGGGRKSKIKQNKIPHYRRRRRRTTKNKKQKTKKKREII